MADLQGFDANQVAPTARPAPLPEGKYLAVITESEWKSTKDEKGAYLQLNFAIIEGEHKGRKITARLNLDNPNPTAVEIAKGELSAICRAVDVMTPGDSSELHNLPLIVDVACKKRSDTNDITNEIKRYYKRDTPPPNAQAGAGDTPPWKRS